MSARRNSAISWKFGSVANLNDANVLPSLFPPSDIPGNDTLKTRPATVVQQMYPVNDGQAYKIVIRGVGALGSGDIPFLGRRDDDLSLSFGDLLNLTVVGNLADFDAEQSL